MERNAFWEDSWAHGETGWKRFEDAKLVRSILEAAFTMTGQDSSLSALRGLRVIVPLCGDTPALETLYRLGAHVTGIELVDAAVVALQASFGPAATWRSEEVSGDDVFTRLTLEQPSELGGTLTVYHGDVFTILPALLASAGCSAPLFDLLYDRACLVALCPKTQRQRYADLIRRTLDVATSSDGSAATDAPTGRIILEVVDRSRTGNPALAGDAAHFAGGPPHHVELSSFGQLYGTGRQFLPLEAFDRTAPPFTFCVFVTA